MGKSEKLFRKAQNLIPGGVNSPVRFYEPYPFFAVRADGSKIFDSDGYSYIDYCMGYGALLLGHNYSSIINSVKSQLNKGSLFCVPTEKEVEVAELITKCVPCAEMVRLVNTGSEATMHAIRLARAFTKRQKIIKFEGCYHGAHDYVLVKAGSGVAHQGIPLSEGMLDSIVENTLVIPYNDSTLLERTIESNSIAAVIIEPVIANMGLVLPEKHFLYNVRKITQQHDTPLIFDEVVTGFRLALGGAQEYYDIKPDLATFGKAISNGFPLAAIAGKEEIMQHLTPVGRVYQASTFAGNPISVSAAIATIKTLMKNRMIYTKIDNTCGKIVKGIRDSSSSLGLEINVNSLGSMFQIFFSSNLVRDYTSAKKSDVKLYKKFFDQLLKEGIFVPPSQYETCFISYSHSKIDIMNTVESFDNALQKVRS
ncbi:MAG: glutamate-1-semialdehyde-2,1-aminomutase [Thaumarchaeota archaeon]|nr:glutamate-1-semialdehyde-2,1-aminomutase [Nitrososphaerota archaeon]